jgi:methyl-accepting chemotaxis protein
MDIKYLKQLSLESLLETEVTSESRKSEKVADAAAAIYVITQEDIRRSGSRSIPDFLVATRLKGIMSEPIASLAGTIRIVADEKDYSVRAEKKSNDELGVLNDGFNEMLDQIQDRDGRLKTAAGNLAADASR